MTTQDAKAVDVDTDRIIRDVLTDTYGTLPLIQSLTRTERTWTSVKELSTSLAKESVWVRGRIHESRFKGKLGFIVLRQQVATVQVVVAGNKDFVKWAGGIPLESIVDIYGEVTVPPKAIAGATQPVELQASKIHLVSRALNTLPFQLRDAERPEPTSEEQPEEGVITVGQDVRLDNRVLDLRTLAMQSVMRISAGVCRLFREVLTAKGFVEIHSPKLIGGTSEGGSNVFTLQYFGRKACLAQSPQLHKQMAICSDLDRVFEIGPVFRAENSNTHRHLCEFTGLDLEMAFKEHYFEVLEIVEQTFKYIFRGLKEQYHDEIELVRRQWPSKDFVWSEKVLRLDFDEGVKMLREANVANVPDDITDFDLSTEQEKTLGKLVAEKYQTDFYYMINYPQKVRPFYTMPNPEKPGYSHSYDFFMRGEEIVSGAQRIHDPNLLSERANDCGIPLETIKSYVDSFRLGAFPHAGVGIGLERVVMLFLGLNNIRKASMFPRDPKRIAP